MKTITVPEAAGMMGKNPQFVRLGLQQGRFYFGTAVKMNKKWAYYINRRQFLRYIGEDDHEKVAD